MLVLIQPGIFRNTLSACQGLAHSRGQAKDRSPQAVKKGIPREVKDCWAKMAAAPPLLLQALALAPGVIAEAGEAARGAPPLAGAGVAPRLGNSCAAARSGGGGA